MKVDIRKDILKNLNFEIDDLFFKKCEEFIKLLQQWGRVHSFTSELEEKQIVANIVDSLIPLNFINKFNSFADVGTGCGYPGLILAMANPNTKAVLIEPRVKRVAFLNFVKNYLELNFLEVVASRVENIKDDFKYDLVTSRAVTNTRLLLDITKNISNENTKYLFYKGSNLQNELDSNLDKNCEVVNLKNRNYLYIKGRV